MLNFKQYKRKAIAELAQWDGEPIGDEVSISKTDRENGSPKAGDFIARNPKDHADIWLVAKDYATTNFELAE